LRIPPNFIGLGNYFEMFQDSAFWNSFRVTVIYVLVSVPLQLAVALAIAILRRQVFGKDGLVNGFLALFGIDGPGWIGHPDYALSTIVILHVWTFGSAMVIFLAGLRQIPEMYYEAAAVDGAGKFRRFVSVTIP